MRPLVLCLMALFCLLVPLGCGGGGESSVGVGSEGRPSAEEAQASRRVREEATVEEETEVSRYSYNAVGKRDPFRSFISKTVVVDSGEEAIGPLQVHEIDQYKLRGIVWNIGAPRALVEDPDGIGHVVDIGTLIGKNWGKVTQIKPEEIVITEEYRDPIENELIINEITMRLPDPGDEDKD